MKKLFILLLFILPVLNLYAQNTLRIIVKDAEEKTPLAGATVAIPSIDKTISADSAGLAIFNDLPIGSHAVIISYVGYSTIEKTFAVPSLAEESEEIF